MERHILRTRLTRRQILKMGLIAGGTAMLPLRSGRGSDSDKDKDRDNGGGSPGVVPFQQDMPIPEVLEPVTDFSYGPPNPQCSLDIPFPHPTLPPLPAPIKYEVRMQVGHPEIVPGTMTEIWGYNGQYPGLTIKVERNKPIVVRFINDLSVDTVIHNHGGHQSEESDSFPAGFIVPGTFKDYCYPNIAPDNDDSEFTSTQWYHDHAMDITGENVYMGLAGFYLLTDHVEQDLITMGKLPSGFDDFGNPFDIPVVLQDRLFAQDGSLIYDPMDHDGVIGDRFLANGAIQPKLHVQRRKYRFRILNGANARVYALRLSTGQPFLQIGNDSWLLPFAVNVPHLLLSPAERADVIIDFRYAPSEVFLTNHLTHDLDDGRGPEEDIDEPDDWRRRGTPQIKFIVEDGTPVNNATIGPGDPLRPHTPILKSEIVRTRRFEFERSHGAWVINDKFFDPDRDDARPQIGTAERWILENSSGGWVHPIHIHLEGQQIQRINGRRPNPMGPLGGKKDTVLLGDFDAEVFIKFRTFPGRFVFHCHNIEHEDMRMMGVFNVQA